MHRFISLLTVCAIFAPFTALSSSAWANRDPTTAEAAAIAAALGTTPDCLVTRISTEDAGWASVDGNAIPECLQPPPALVMRFDGSTWTTIRTVERVGELCPFPGVPTRVALDFALCETPAMRVVRMSCSRGWTDRTQLTHKPRSCNLIQSRAMATLTRFRKLRWTGWNGTSARGHGVLLPNHPGQGEQPVRASLYAYRVLPSCENRLDYRSVYTRLRVRTRDGTFTQILNEGCDFPAHRREFSRYVERYLSARITVTDFRQVERVGCSIQGLSSRRREAWFCAGTYSWYDEFDSECTETFWGRFDDDGYFERAVITERSSCT